MELDLSDYYVDDLSYSEGVEDEREQLAQIIDIFMEYCQSIQKNEKDANYQAYEIAQRRLNDFYLAYGALQRESLRLIADENDVEQARSILESLCKQAGDSQLVYKKIQLLGNLEQLNKNTLWNGIRAIIDETDQRMESSEKGSQMGSSVNEQRNKALTLRAKAASENAREQFLQTSKVYTEGANQLVNVGKDRAKRRKFAEECLFMDLDPVEQAPNDPPLVGVGGLASSSSTHKATKPKRDIILQIALRMCLTKALDYAPPDSPELEIYQSALDMISADDSTCLKLGPLLDEGTRHISYARALVSQKLRRLLFNIEKFIWRFVLQKLKKNIRRWHRHLTRMHGFVLDQAPVLDSILVNPEKVSVVPRRRKEMLKEAWLVMTKYTTDNVTGETTSVLSLYNSKEDVNAIRERPNLRAELPNSIDLRAIKGFVFGNGCCTGPAREQNACHCMSIIYQELAPIDHQKGMKKFIPKFLQADTEDYSIIGTSSLQPTTGGGANSAGGGGGVDGKRKLSFKGGLGGPANGRILLKKLDLVFEEFDVLNSWLTALQMIVKLGGYRPDCVVIPPGKVFWLRLLYSLRRRLHRPHFSFAKCLNAMWTQVRLVDGVTEYNRTRSVILY